MGFFSTSKSTIKEAVSEALQELQLPAPVTNEVTVEMPDSVEISSREMRPGRDGVIVTEEMLGKPLNPRPHALWANGPMTVMVVGDNGDTLPLTTMMASPIEFSPVAIESIQGDATLVALYP